METTPEPTTEQRLTETENRGGASALIAGGGITAIVLAIIGLAHMLPGYLVAVSTVIVGGSLVLQGTILASRFTRTVSLAPHAQQNEAQVGGAVTAEILGGAAGFILGLLALLGLPTDFLVPVAAIVFGASLLLGSRAALRIGMLRASVGVRDRAAQVIEREAASSRAAIQAVVGAASIVLGIIAVVQIQVLVLTLVAMLILGAAVLLSTASLGNEIISGMFRGA